MLLDDLYISKSFVCIGESLKKCFDCKYCRLLDERKEKFRYLTLPVAINKLFTKLPIVINIFYGDPLLQLGNTLSLLAALEKARHKGPVIIITKGDFSNFPDRPFNLDLHIAFSTFGKENKTNKYNGVSTGLFEKNLQIAFSRVFKYKYSIEFRPIIYNINDSNYSIDYVMRLAHKYKMAIGYSGLQGKPSVVKIWKNRKYNLKPYPGYCFGHKKVISNDRIKYIRNKAKELNVPIFSKTSCLISYTHSLDRDYNSHYYRPSEVGCKQCKMKKVCQKAKSLRDSLEINTSMIPFKHKLFFKKKHVCILKQKNICEFPTKDCSNISGGLIKINQKITTADVRVIKWLTGYTVDADFFESSQLSSVWRD